MALEDVLHRIRRAEAKANRPAGSVELTAVSKVQPIERVEAVLDQGHRLFGENRVQEAQGKWPTLKQRYDGIRLHLIGPLQTNKVKAALELFDAIESVDRESVAEKIAAELEKSGRSQPLLYVQVNTGEEPQKAGIAPGEADALIERCRGEYGLEIAGLMVIPPADEPPAPHFALLSKIAERNSLAKLSMGMSGDFETAIEFGATEVRVGSAVFGDRVPGAVTAASE